MLLSDTHLRKVCRDSIFPFREEMLQPSSIDLVLDRYFLTERGPEIPTFGNPLFGEDRPTRFDPKVNNDHKLHRVDVPRGAKFSLGPGDFALASTYERVRIPDKMAARFEGKSSLGRIGLFTHITAGFIDPGFEGHITLELFNATQSRIVLYPGMKIGQLCFFELSTLPSYPYGSSKFGSHYQGQERGPVASRIDSNFKVYDIYGEGDDNAD